MTAFRQARRLATVVTDGLDYLARAVRGRSHLPPRSLRQRVGGAANFEQVGPWFLRELDRLGLWLPGCRVFDLGCGCGRLAHTFATDPGLRELEVSYTGMDIDRQAVGWCRRHITPLNPRFDFLSADLYNSYYNPEGQVAAADYRFPHPDGSFDLILLTSVFTHLLESDVRAYLLEMRRLLSARGAAYASFFLYRTREDLERGQERHPLAFPVFRGDHALHDGHCPERAVAYRESFARTLVEASGFRVAEVGYGTQDFLVLRPTAPTR